MLERGRARRPASVGANVTVIDPVYIEDNVTLRGATVGPNVSIGAGSTIDGSELRDTIVGSGSRVASSQLRNSLIGDAATVEGVRGEVNVADHSVVRVVE
jgi:glucose-1-phosphate thymidylyltransferase